MDIRIKARLNAYAKIDNLNNIPTPTEEDKNSLLGIDSTGKYVFYKSITNEYIDYLFDGFPPEPPMPVYRKGDLNGDGLVNMEDIYLFRDYLLGNPTDIPHIENADMNGDGKITFEDYEMLVSLVKDENPDLVYVEDADIDALFSSDDPNVPDVPDKDDTEYVTDDDIDDLFDDDLDIPGEDVEYVTESDIDDLF